ncbi:MAG: hypothetical protein ACE5E6_11465, partial [Phycisphaerae bacterium]
DLWIGRCVGNRILIQVPPTPPLPGDGDADGDVDLVDFQRFVQCFHGPGDDTGNAGCTPFDIDGDTDIDLADFASLQVAFTGKP